MRSKIKIWILVFAIGISSAYTSTSLKAEESPSFWAVEEITNAQFEGIVPERLQKNYQEDIKRYEYVLLALRLLDIKNDQVMIVSNYPFIDIEGHFYEDEIIRAYNAGIIKGYGDGTFQPDAPITREEIASLLVNLIRRIKLEDSITNTTIYNFSDESSIDVWAKEYMNYCYEHDIIKGTGKDELNQIIVEPDGLASREQAILMFYRLADRMELLSTSDFGTVQVLELDTDDGDGTYTESEGVNEFSKTFGSDVTKVLIEIISDSEVNLLNISKDYTRISYGPNGTLELMHDGYSISVISTEVEGYNKIRDDMIEMVNSIQEDNGLNDAINRDMNIFVGNGNHSSNLTLKENSTYSSKLVNINGALWYGFNFTLQFN